ncbi:MAG: serine hydrolase domain-containing protein [Actinomycetota bacterium]
MRRTMVRLVALVSALALVAACGDDVADTATATTIDAPATVQAEGDLPPAEQADLEAALVDVMERLDVPGASVAVRTPDGTWQATAGVADLETAAPITEDLTWPLRSITKSVAVTVLLQLVDEGLVDLDATVDTYVEGVPDGDVITLRQLAAMTSGIGDYSQSEAFAEAYGEDPGRVFTLDELNEIGYREGTQFEPGSDAVYSNTSTNVIGRVIEEVTGTTVDAAITERIIEPLELSGTAYPTTVDDWPDHASGYQPDDDGEIAPGPPNNFTVFGPAGAMIATIGDLLTWAEALGSGSALSAAVHEERFDGRPLSEGPEYDAYGLGLGELSGWWGHTGEGLGYTALVMYDPATGSAIAVGMNVSNETVEGADGNPVSTHAPTEFFRQAAEILA